MITETAILTLLQRGELQFPPLILRLLDRPSAEGLESLPKAATVVEIKWEDRRCLFLVEVRASNTPRAIRDASDVTGRVNTSQFGWGHNQPVITSPIYFI